jgi:hypothetical protein
MKAELEVFLPGRAAEKGTYTVAWLSVAQWKSELIVGDFQRIEVVNGETLWLHQTFGADPKWGGELFHDVPKVALFAKKFDNYQVRSIQDEAVEGVKARCVEVMRSNMPPENYCVDNQRGLLVSARLVDFEDEDKPLMTCHFQDYAKFREKMIPRSISCEEAGKGSFAIRTELQSDLPAAELSFAPPNDSYRLKYCTGILTPPRLHKQSPRIKYPKGKPEAPLNPVVLWGIVGEDGRVHNLSVVQSQGPLFDNATTQAAESWIYKPATCDGSAISGQMVLRVNFRKH